MNYDKIEGWFDFADLYDAVVESAPAGSLLIEVGCYLGRSLCYLGEVAKRSVKGLRVVGVDHGIGSGVESDLIDHQREAVTRGGGTTIGELHRNVIACGLADTVSLVVAPSTIAAALFAPESAHFVFVDASHYQEAVEADINSWLPVVRSGGILAGHDYNGHWIGVKRAVEKLLPAAVPCSISSWRFDKE